MNNQIEKRFIEIGDRVRFIGNSTYRNDNWPTGAWIQFGIEGAVKEFHDEVPATMAGGRKFEGIPAYAVVKFDNGAETCIDPDEENSRWTRLPDKISKTGIMVLSGDTCPRCDGQIVQGECLQCGYEGEENENDAYRP